MIKMTYQEQQARAAQKRRVLLDFLSSGEVYTSTKIIAELLQITEQTVAPLLKKLVAEKVLRVDERPIPFSKLKIFGITAHGLAVTETANPQCREFRVGTLNPSYLAHHLDGQRVRIAAERAGWTSWVPSKILYVDNTKRLKKLPDALAIRPDGLRVAIEIERFIKSYKRMMAAQGAHLQQIVQNHYDLVYYFTPHPLSLKKVFAGIETVVLQNGEKITLTESHRSRFKIFDIKNPTF